MSHKALTLFLFVSIGACNKQNPAELDREQARERRDLQQEQTEEQREARQEARDKLADQTEQVRSEQADVDRERGALVALVDRACRGVAEASRLQCPLDRGSVSQVRNVDNGVMLRLTSPASNEGEIEGRVQCYQAALESRNFGSRGSNPSNENREAPSHDCVLDYPDVRVDVDDNNGKVEVELATDSNTRIEDLRTRVKQWWSSRIVGT